MNPEDHAFHSRFGRKLYFPEAYEGADRAERDAYERGRGFGHWEADNAINWQLSCMRCASNLDHRAAGFFEGERAGLDAALRVVDQIASRISTTDAFIMAKMIKEGLSRPANTCGSTCVHVCAEDCTTPERPR